MRFLADECVSRRIVQRLRDDQHDVIWIGDIERGGDDESVLNLSVTDSRILLTEDWDFGELAVRLKKRALGIVIVAIPSLAGRIDEVAGVVARRLAEAGEQGLIGKLTILEAGRMRQRDLEEGTSR